MSGSLEVAQEYRQPMFRFPTIRGILEAVASKLIRWGLDMFPSDSPSISHAKTELKLAGMFDTDSDYNGALGDAVIDLMKVFSTEGHSGFSASMTTSLFERVSRYEVLTPLTGEDDEWVIHDYGSGPYAQNRRCGRVFKNADGSAYDIDGKVFREPSGVCYTSYESRVPVTFPYVPKTEYIDVPEPPATL